MNNSIGPMIMFFTLCLTLISGVFIYLYLSGLPSKEKAIQCKNDWSTISFLINEDDQILMMAGETFPKERIKVFNKTAVSAQWQGETLQTKMFLDRIAGTLEISTKEKNDTEWDKSEFTCSQSAIRF